MLVDAANALYPQCSASTKNRGVFTPAAAILHYAAENDLCAHARVKKLKEKRPEPRAIRKEDADRLIAFSDGKMRLLLVFLFAQGWRIGDTLRLTWQNIDLAEATIRYHIAKTDSRLTMPLHLAVLNMLRDDPTGDNKVIGNRLLSNNPTIGRVFPWRNVTALYRELRPLCRAAGVAFTPHCARHSFATWLGADGASTKEIMEAHGAIIGPFSGTRASMRSA